MRITHNGCVAITAITVVFASFGAHTAEAQEAPRPAETWSATCDFSQALFIGESPIDGVVQLQDAYNPEAIFDAMEVVPGQQFRLEGPVQEEGTSVELAGVFVVPPAGDDTATEADVEYGQPIVWASTVPTGCQPPF